MYFVSEDGSKCLQMKSRDVVPQLSAAVTAVVALGEEIPDSLHGKE